MASDRTTLLNLPYIAAAQAQKHVTHNDALNVLDALVQLSVLSDTVSSPPSTPADGDRYIVPIGGTGAFSGIATRIASFQSGAWTNFVPQRGWVAYIVDRGELRYFDGAAWQAITSAITTLPKLGINASADTVNRLSIAAQATLLNNDGAGHQLKINKATATDTASLLYQTAFSGRAEMGLAGNDMFSLKTSPNGSSFLTAMLVNQTTGAVSFPQGVASVGGSALSGLQRIRNGNFAINQRVVGGTVTLAAGAYGHDGVKAGSAGATYTFATSGLDTTLSISAGTLVLPVEDKLVEGGVYTLSWSGTATARVYQGTPSGSYGASPRITATLSANAHVYAEFGTGTVGLVQLQPGSLATQFERRPFPAELALCQRYFEKSYDQGTALGAVFSPGAGAGSLGSNALFVINLPTSAYLSGGTANFKATKRLTPAITVYSAYSGVAGKVRDTANGVDVTASTTNIGDASFVWYATNSATQSSFNFQMHWAASAEI